MLPGGADGLTGLMEHRAGSNRLKGANGPLRRSGTGTGTGALGRDDDADQLWRADDDPADRLVA